jgi:hypothetical protein
MEPVDQVGSQDQVIAGKLRQGLSRLLDGSDAVRYKIQPLRKVSFVEKRLPPLPIQSASRLSLVQRDADETSQKSTPVTLEFLASRTMPFPRTPDRVPRRGRSFT